MRRLARLRTRPDSQRGAFAVLYAIILPVMLGMIGLAVDLAMMYARGHELQAIADGAALAAARALDGTAAGLQAAKDNARSNAIKAEYRFLRAETISWSSAALSFGASADGPWIGADAVAPADLPTLFFARVDTSKLDQVYGAVAPTFLRVVGVVTVQQLARHAVAGRKDSALGPLAVCALNNTPITMRSNAPATGVDEAVEYGFRRGVTYNLLNLTPNGTSAKNYTINPLDFAPAPEVASHHSDAALRPFACTGAIPAPRLSAGDMLYVKEPFPPSMVNELNSRFGDYGNGSICTKFGAPPDSNIIDFRGGYTYFWMSVSPTHASAASYTSGSKLMTIADAASVVPGTVAADYGTLWSFGKPLRYDSATGGLGLPFSKSDWPKLYGVTSGSVLASTYTNTASPYAKNQPPNRQLPTPLSGAALRRVLNVPLLECPVSGSSARMLAIGSFLMTTPGTVSPAGIYAEFGGLTTYGPLAASAVLYQ
jgi:hypothetical protein